MEIFSKDRTTAVRKLVHAKCATPLAEAIVDSCAARNTEFATKSDIKDLQTEIGNLQSDLTSVKQDLSRMKTDLELFKSDVRRSFELLSEKLEGHFKLNEAILDGFESKFEGWKSKVSLRVISGVLAAVGLITALNYLITILTGGT